MAKKEGPAMPQNIDDLLPTAKEIQKQAAIKEAEKADELTPGSWPRRRRKSAP